MLDMRSQPQTLILLGAIALILLGTLAVRAIAWKCGGS
jgi:hypothetical protein